MENLSIFLMCIGIVFPITILPLHLYKGDKAFKIDTNVKKMWVVSMIMLVSGLIIHSGFGVYFVLACPPIIILVEHLTGSVNWKTYISYILDSNYIVINNLLNGK